MRVVKRQSSEIHITLTDTRWIYHVRNGRDDGKSVTDGQQFRSTA